MPHQISEYYDVVKTVIFVAEYQGQEETFKFEVMRDDLGNHKVRAYIHRHVRVDYTFENPNQHSNEVRIWLDHSIPWVDSKDPDSALRQALSLAMFTH